MAQETEKILGDLIAEGIVVTKYQHALPLTKCNTIEAGHPVPDQKSVEGGEAVMHLFSKTQNRRHYYIAGERWCFGFII